MVDTLSIFCFLIGYPLTTHIQKTCEGKRKLFNSSFICFLTLMLISTSVEIVGAFTLSSGNYSWDTIPAVIDTRSSVGMSRLWSFRDSPIERSTRSLLHKINRFSVVSSTYIQGLDGKIKQVRLTNQSSSLTPLTGASGASVLMQVDLQNTGTSEWLSYAKGVGSGSVLVRTRFYDATGNMISEGQLFVLESPRVGEQATAVGYVSLPINLGAYRLVLDLVSEKKFAQDSDHFYELPVKVDSEQQIFSQEFSDVRMPKVVVAGKMFNLFTIAQSHSNFTWVTNFKSSINKISNPVTFSYRWVNLQGRVEVIEGERTSLPWNVFYNRNSFYDICNSIGINATVKAPDRPGDYILRLTMVQEGVGWFDEKGAKPKDIPVTVTQS